MAHIGLDEGLEDDYVPTELENRLTNILTDVGSIREQGIDAMEEWYEDNGSDFYDVIEEYIASLTNNGFEADPQVVDEIIKKKYLEFKGPLRLTEADIKQTINEYLRDNQRGGKRKMRKKRKIHNKARKTHKKTKRSHKKTHKKAHKTHKTVKRSHKKTHKKH